MLLQTLNISIVALFFGQRDYIGRIVEDILVPQYSNINYFFWNGGSKDGVVEILRTCQDKMIG